MGHSSRANPPHRHDGESKSEEVGKENSNSPQSPGESNSPYSTPTRYQHHHLSHTSSDDDHDDNGRNVHRQLRNNTLRRRAAQATSSQPGSSTSSPSLSSSTPPVLTPPTITPMTACRRVLYYGWKLLQTLFCVLSFFACGGFFCGGCCLPCGGNRRGSNSHPPSRRSSRSVPHRRRRRRSLANIHTGIATPRTTPGTPKGEAMIPPLLLGAAEQAQQNEDYESWTEDDDSEFEYEPTDSYAHRHSTSCFCRFMMILVAVLAVYIMLFVRVNPTSIRGVNELEVEFGFNNLVPSMNLPIPDQLHQFTSALIGQASRPGMTARMDGLRAHFPIVFVPGIVSTGLEVWQGEKCARDHFRQRLWGSTLMIRTMLLDSRCWLRHLSLDGWSGLDPDGIKLRAATGLEASDYLVGGFWVWAKMIQNFADVGYDVNSMMMAPYDWRLSFKHLQERDYYFSKLKYTIEIAKLSNHNRKVILIAHSMGGNVVHYFLKWVESHLGGAGGPTWVHEHIESVVGIGVPWLGTPKVFSAIFSGEMKDTAELAPWIDSWRQRVVFNQADVLNIIRTFRSLPSMMPKGGNIVWGDYDSAPDDPALGEIDEPDMKPTKDYPGGRDQRFMTSQATAELKDEGKYHDAQRVHEAKQRASRFNQTHSTLANSTASSPSLTNASSSSSSYVRQFVSFTAAIPWPFPNITSIFEEAHADHNYGASHEHAHSHHILPRSLERRMLHKEWSLEEDWIEELRESVATEKEKADKNRTKSELTFEDSLYLLKQVASADVEFDEELYSQGFGSKRSLFDFHETEEEKPIDLLDVDPSSPSNVLDDQRYWANPLETSLPMAPELKIYCLYGVGRDSERGYVYAKASSIPSLPKISDLLTSSSEKTARMHPTVAKSKTSTTNEKTKSEADHKNQPERSEEEDEDDVEANQEDVDETSSSSPESPSSSNEDSSTRPIGARSPTIPLFAINTSYHLPEARIRSGVKLADGDGTVPLVSLGYMCIDGWKQKRWNPAGLSVITREYRDLNESLAILRSSTSVDHVDIMGNSDMIRDILYIACRRTNSHKKHPNSTTTNVPDKDNDKRDGGKSDEEVYEEVKDESKEDQISSSSNSNSGGDASDPLSHPLGELTWTEVTERVYSRIRPIAQRLHHRWEKRTGHELEEADKPPPLNPHTQKHDVEEIETATDSDTGSKPVKLNFDWTAEDEARLHELIVRKKQADRLKMEAAAAVKKSNPSSSSSTSSSPSWTSSPPPDQPSTDSFLERFHDRFHELESHLRDVMDSASAAVLGVNSNEQAKRREEEEIEQQLERRAQHRTVQTTKHKQQ